MLDDILDIPNHIRDAIWRFDSARLEPKKSVGLLVCGMGGSAIGGELARGILSSRLSGPLVVVRNYRLPRWVNSNWAVLGSSYSGDTEETFSAFVEAREVGAHRWAVGTGGRLGEYSRDQGIGFVGLPGSFQPRTTVAYMTTAAALAAYLADIAPDLHDELAAAADFLDESKAEMQEVAADLALGMDGIPLVVHGAETTVPVARRWANQLNENTKQFAFPVEVPEANHNLMEAWDAGNGGLGAVFLVDEDQTDRERERLKLTSEAIERTGAAVFSIESRGGTSSERVLWMVMLGDLISINLADRRGVDPLPVNQIADFKRRLGAR